MLFVLFLFLVSCFFLMFYSVHYIFLLLSLEMILLGVFVTLSLLFLGVSGLSGLFLYFLVMVCMGGFSLSLLVSLSRGYGSDFWRPGSLL